jgi:hypothetical protein
MAESRRKAIAIDSQLRDTFIKVALTWISFKLVVVEVAEAEGFPGELPISGSSSVAERQLPKLNVAGSIPVSRSKKNDSYMQKRRPRLLPERRSFLAVDKLISELLDCPSGPVGNDLRESEPRAGKSQPWQSADPIGLRPWPLRAGQTAK